MSIGRDTADTVFLRAEDLEPHRGNQGEQRVEAPTEIPEASPTRTQDARLFAYIWHMSLPSITGVSG